MKTSKILKFTLLGFAFGAVSVASAQVKVGDNPASVNPDAVLEIESTNKGLLLPRIALTSTTAFAPMTAHVAGMKIYNTATAGDVTPGIYYNDGTKWIRVAAGDDIKTEPWFEQGTDVEATDNTQDIYQEGKVAIGFTDADGVTTKQLEVKGDMKATYTGTAVTSIVDNNLTGFTALPNYAFTTGEGTNVMISTDNEDLNNASKLNYVYTANDIGGFGASALTSRDGDAIAQVMASTIGSIAGSSLTAVNNIDNRAAEVTAGTSVGVELRDGTPTGVGTTVRVNQTDGVRFLFRDSNGDNEGQYVFPRNNGTANQVLTTNGGVGVSQLAWQDVSDLVPNDDWKITGNDNIDADVNFLGTTTDDDLVFKRDNIQAGWIGPDADQNTSFGLYALQRGVVQPSAVGVSPVTGKFNGAIGYGALTGLTTGTRNQAQGNFALGLVTTGSNNVGIGNGAGRKIVTTGNNTAIGNFALEHGTPGPQSGNTAIGSSALRYSTGSNNVALGYLAASGGTGTTHLTTQITGSNNIAIGANQTLADPAASNQLNIGGAIFGTGLTGNQTTPAGNIGIGIATPSNTLHVVATANPARLEGLQAGAATDAVVTADATGVLRTVATSTLAIEPWQIQGGTAKATANGDNIYQTGSVSIGSSAVIPTFSSGGSTITPKFHVAGDVSTTGAFYTATGVYADYVFEDYFDGSSKLKEDYNFKTLVEIENFINQNRHLPGIAKIDNLTKNENGDYIINTTELSVQLLEKVEELYLYTIEQQNLIKKQQTEIQDMKTRLERLENLLLEKK